MRAGRPWVRCNCGERARRGSHFGFGSVVNAAPGPAHPGRRLRTFLGSAPGVGKTYAMLNEGWQRAQTGERVVVGWLDSHCRADTRGEMPDLQVRFAADGRSSRTKFRRARRRCDPRTTAGRRSVDELAHTNADGVRRRWEDVDELLDAGVGVMTTVNVANLLSGRDYAARITGAGTVESVPDAFVRGVKLLSSTCRPRRCRASPHRGPGLFTRPRSWARALSNYFRESNLARLSQLTRAWMEGTIEVTGPAVCSPTPDLGRARRAHSVVAGSIGGEGGPKR